jgi:hypothetical protein
MKVWRAMTVALAVPAVAAGALFFFRESLATLWIERHLAAALSAATGADIELHDVVWRDGVLRAGRGTMNGGALPFGKLEVKDVRAALEWKQLLEPLSRPLHVEIAEAALVWRGTGEAVPDRGSGGAAGAVAMPDVDLLVASLTVQVPEKEGWTLRDTSARAVRTRGSWSFSARGGTVGSAGWPPLEVERVSATHSGSVWNIGGFALRDGTTGALAGSAANDGGRWSGEFSWQDLDAAKWLPGEAATRFAGKMSGDAVLRDGILRGKTKIAGGSMEKVPQMVQMASLFVGENWDRVPWDVFRFEFTRQPDGRVDFAHLEAVSPKGLALHGEGHYAADSLGATLQLGVSGTNRPWLVAFVPSIFRAQKSGYFWTTVRVGGTPEAPVEDLTTRLVTAAATVPAAAAVEAAAEIPGAAADAAGDLLRSLLGR